MGGLVTYPIMMPLLYAGIFWRVRRAVGNNQPTELSHALRFMTDDFDTSFFFWDLVEMMKKLVLMGAMSTVYPGTISQLVLAYMFVICFMVALLVAKPYKRDGDDALALAANFGLVMFFFFSLILKVQDLIERMDASLTDRLRDEFEFDTSTNAGLLIAASFGATGLAGLMMLFGVVRESRMEAKRLRRHSGPEVHDELDERKSDESSGEALASSVVAGGAAVTAAAAAGGIGLQRAIGSLS